MIIIYILLHIRMSFAYNLIEFTINLKCNFIFKILSFHSWNNMLIYLIIGDGNFAKNDSGAFIHTGGWLFVHEYDINL